MPAWGPKEALWSTDCSRPRNSATCSASVDGLFYDRHAIDRLDLIVQAEILDLAPDLMEIVNLLPPGYYDRQSLCDQLNSALAAHGWGRRLRNGGISLEAGRFGPLPDLGEVCFRACGQKRANMSTVTFFSSSDSWSKSAKLDLKLPNHRQLAPNWKSMVTH